MKIVRVTSHMPSCDMPCASYPGRQPCPGAGHIAVAVNLHLPAAMPGGLTPWEPMLEFDTTENVFRDNPLVEPLDVQGQVKGNGGTVAIPTGPGLGVLPDQEFIRRCRIA